MRNRASTYYVLVVLVDERKSHKYDADIRGNMGGKEITKNALYVLPKLFRFTCQSQTNIPIRMLLSVAFGIILNLIP